MHWTHMEYLHCILLLRMDILSACEHCLMLELLVMLEPLRNDLSGLLLQVSVIVNCICSNSISAVAEVGAMNTHTELFYGSLDFVQDNLGEPVPEEIFTHSHALWSSNIPICFIYYNPWHTPYSIHVLYCLFPQSLSKFSLVYLLAWHPPLHTPYISSPNLCLIFAAHEYDCLVANRKSVDKIFAAVTWTNGMR